MKVEPGETGVKDSLLFFFGGGPSLLESMRQLVLLESMGGGVVGFWLLCFLVVFCWIDVNMWLCFLLCDLRRA